jgi:hypothetical protein
MMNFITSLTIEHLERYHCPVAPIYVDLLQTATETNPPPYGKAWYGKAYRQSARQAEWFAESLILNAYEEGTGAGYVWQFAAQSPHPQFVELIRNHAIDESRHSKMFATLLDTLFPTQIENTMRERVKSFAPGYKPGDEVKPQARQLNELEAIDRLIQTNLLEIRALVLQLLLRPVLQAYAQPQDLERVRAMSDRFIYDETQHVAYTAHCISEYWQWGDREWLRETIIAHQAHVNCLFMGEEEVDTLRSELSAALLIPVSV